MAQANVYSNVQSADNEEDDYELVDDEGRIVEEDYINPVKTSNVSTGEEQGSVTRRTETFTLLENTGATSSKILPARTSKKRCTKQCTALVFSISMALLVIALIGFTIYLCVELNKQKMEVMGIAQLETALDESKKKVAELQEQVTGLQDRDTELQDQVTELQEQDTELNTSVLTQTQELHRLKNYTDTQISESKRKVAEQVIGLHEQVTELLDQVTELQEQDTELQDQVTELQELGTELNTSVLTQTQELHRLKNYTDTQIRGTSDTNVRLMMGQNLLAGIHGFDMERALRRTNAETNYTSCRCNERAPCNISSLGTSSQNRIGGCSAGVFQSDNYPSSYTNNFNHTWTIKRPHIFYLWMILDLKDFRFESGCSYDYLLVNDEDKICYTGVNSTRRIYPVYNNEEITMRFTTDGSSFYRGFKAYFMFI